jgi:uncharacterized protein with PIN domain
MTTPIELGAAKKTFDWLKNGATYVFRLAKRIATLEERVTALEDALKNAPADACPYCGERALRLSHQSSTAMGTHPKRWTEETWTCGKCNKEYLERIPI